MYGALLNRPYRADRKEKYEYKVHNIKKKYKYEVHIKKKYKYEVCTKLKFLSHMRLF